MKKILIFSIFNLFILSIYAQTYVDSQGVIINASNTGTNYEEDVEYIIQPFNAKSVEITFTQMNWDMTKSDWMDIYDLDGNTLVSYNNGINNFPIVGQTYSYPKGIMIYYYGDYNTNTSFQIKYTTTLESVISPWNIQNNELYTNMSVGIGMIPAYKFNVSGDIYCDGGWLRATGNKGLFFQSYGGGLYMTDNSWIRTYGGKNFYHDAGIMRTDGSLQVGPDGNRFVVTQGGSVGIGTSTPNMSYKLDVAGSIRANEIKVNTTGADFVFEPTYKLRPLTEVETFIKTNKHLPDVAPATEMETNGVSMGEMQAKLLQKVEELTLYSIELKRENTELKQEMKELKELIMKKLK